MLLHWPQGAAAREQLANDFVPHRLGCVVFSTQSRNQQKLLLPGPHYVVQPQVAKDLDRSQCFPGLITPVVKISDLIWYRSHLVWLEAGGHPCVLLQRAPGVIIRVWGWSLVDVTSGGGLTTHTRHQGLQLDLARHPASHVGFGFSEMKLSFSYIVANIFKDMENILKDIKEDV